MGKTSVGDLFVEIEGLSAANRAARELDTERRLLQLRHRAGLGLAADAHGFAAHVEPSDEPLRQVEGLPEFSPAELTPERLRATILRDGCMIVRGLVDRDAATSLAAGIEVAFEQREHRHAGQPWDHRYYDEFRAEPPFRAPLRRWIEESGGLLVADSPAVAFDLMETFDRAGVPQLVAAYLGDRVALSIDKTTLRRVEPTAGGGWHQDGAFMGQVRSLNLWLALSDCGDDAPTLDLVPRRFNELVPSGTEGAMAATQVSPAMAQRAAGDDAVVRPVFAPGDAVLFDELCLHQTGCDPGMDKRRYAVESWFFATSSFPVDYSPLAVAALDVQR